MLLGFEHSIIIFYYCCYFRCTQRINNNEHILPFKNCICENTFSHVLRIFSVFLCELSHTTKLFICNIENGTIIRTCSNDSKFAFSKIQKCTEYPILLQKIYSIFSRFARKLIFSKKLIYIICKFTRSKYLPGTIPGTRSVGRRTVWAPLITATGTINITFEISSVWRSIKLAIK